MKILGISVTPDPPEKGQEVTADVILEFSESSEAGREAGRNVAQPQLVMLYNYLRILSYRCARFCDCNAQGTRADRDWRVESSSIIIIIVIHFLHFCVFSLCIKKRSDSIYFNIYCYYFML